MANVVINCDDFGLSPSTNEAIGTLFQKKIITSCSALVNFKDIYSAKDIANKYAFTNNIGLHFNITQGYPLTDDIKACSRIFSNGMLNDDFRSNKIKILGSSPVFVNFLSKLELSAIQREFNAQVDKFLDIFGILPSHMDSHHGCHHDPILYLYICKWARNRGIKAVRPQFNMYTGISIKRLVKSTLNKYAKYSLTNQADFFGTLEEFSDYDYDFNKNSNVEIMVHAIPTTSGQINDIDGINLEQKILDAKLHQHHQCSYRNIK